MDRSELARRVNALPGRFEGRLREAGMRQVAGAIVGGEWDVGVRNLIAGLVRYGVPVSAGDRDELAALLGAMERPVDVLDGLTVRD